MRINTISVFKKTKQGRIQGIEKTDTFVNPNFPELHNHVASQWNIEFFDTGTNFMCNILYFFTGKLKFEFLPRRHFIVLFCDFSVDAFVLEAEFSWFCGEVYMIRLISIVLQWFACRND